MAWNGYGTMKDRNRKILKYAGSLAIAAVLLYFSFRGVKWEDFIGGLKECRWEFVLLSMAASIAAFWLRGVRWRQILLPLDPFITRLTAFNAVNIGYIANFIFPRIGEFVRCGVISAGSAAGHIAYGKSAGHDDAGSSVCDSVSGADGTAEERTVTGKHPVKAEKVVAGEVKAGVATYDKVLGTVVLERGWDLLTMFAVAVVLLVAGWDRFGSFFVENMWKPVSGMLDFSLWWIVSAAVAVVAVCIWAVWKCRNRNRVCGKICSVLRGMLDGFTSAFRMDGKFMFIVRTLLIWGMYWLMAVFTMMAIPDLGGLNAVDALFLMVAGSFGWLVPVPGGFGSFHIIVSLALSAIYGIPQELGIIFATLSHESQAITMALCGGVSYFYETFRK